MLFPCFIHQKLTRFLAGPVSLPRVFPCGPPSRHSRFPSAGSEPLLASLRLRLRLHEALFSVSRPRARNADLTYHCRKACRETRWQLRNGVPAANPQPNNISLEPLRKSGNSLTARAGKWATTHQFALIRFRTESILPRRILMPATAQLHRER